MRFVLVASGGALGSMARYALTEFVHRYAPASFPYGTFVVNAVGCLLFGAVVGLAEGRVLLGVGARTFLLVGVLGGFTTFSSFSYESLQLARDGQFALAAVNGLGQLAVGFLAVWAGFSLVRGL